jgi:hypothetical protein
LNVSDSGTAPLLVERGWQAAGVGVLSALALAAVQKGGVCFGCLCALPSLGNVVVIVGAKSLNNANGQLEDGIAEITAALGGEHRSAAE